MGRNSYLVTMDLSSNKLDRNQAAVNMEGHGMK